MDRKIAFYFLLVIALLLAPGLVDLASPELIERAADICLVAYCLIFIAVLITILKRFFAESINGDQCRERKEP